VRGARGRAGLSGDTAARPPGVRDHGVLLGLCRRRTHARSQPKGDGQLHARTGGLNGERASPPDVTGSAADILKIWNGDDRPPGAFAVPGIASDRIWPASTAARYSR
jgi:hypothetical protein